MTTLSKVIYALTIGGSDDWFDVLLKFAQIAIAGAIFLAGCVMLLPVSVP